MIEQVVGPGAVELHPAQAGSQLEDVGREVKGVQDLGAGLGLQGRRHLAGVVAGLLGDAETGRDGPQGVEQIVGETQCAKNVDCVQDTS